MNKLILTVDSEKHLKYLSRFLHSVSFIKNIEQEKEDEKLEKEVEEMLAQRWSDYKKIQKVLFPTKN